MVNLPSRNNRRRRVLNEEVLGAGHPRAAARRMADEEPPRPGLVPRYSEAAGVENHPQITDFVPCRHRTIALLLLLGLASTAMTSALHYVAPHIAKWDGGEKPPLLRTAVFDLSASGSFSSWVASIVLLAAAALCLLIHSIRRHRIDDYRGRYRIWLAAAAAFLFLSADSVCGLHQLLASTLSYATGWTALREGAIWWLVLAGLPCVWIGLRAFLDVTECRLAASLLVAALGCHTVGLCIHLGIAAVNIESVTEKALVGTAVFCGHWLLLTAAVSYARFVILDVQGLIAHKVDRKRQSSSSPSRPPEDASEPDSSADHDVHPQPPCVYPRETPAVTSWVDGSRPEREFYDDDDDQGESRKLTKADRKRLRKLKSQRRAA